MQFTGAMGRLLAGGRDVATLRDWTIEHREDGSVVRATMETIDLFLLGHSARFDLVLYVGARNWRWRRVELEVRGEQMNARVKGKPEAR